MEKSIYNINNLIDVIQSYSLALHKTTFRYGIDYVKCDSYLKERYPEIFKELEEYFIPRKVNFIYKTDTKTSYPNKSLIECGNKYEQETMIGVPKAKLTPIDGNETLIEDLTWVMVGELSKTEVDEYRDKLKLIISIKNYDWLNKDTDFEFFSLITKNEPSLKHLKMCDFINEITKTTNQYQSIDLNIVKIDLGLENRLVLSDIFNPIIRTDCLNTVREDSYFEETETERNNWLDTLSVIPKEILKITYNEKNYEIYV
jgi:hypothetical protein